MSKTKPFFEIKVVRLLYLFKRKNLSELGNVNIKLYLLMLYTFLLSVSVLIS